MKSEKTMNEKIYEIYMSGTLCVPLIIILMFAAGMLAAKIGKTASKRLSAPASLAFSAAASAAVAITIFCAVNLAAEQRLVLIGRTVNGAEITDYDGKWIYYRKSGSKEQRIMATGLSRKTMTLQDEMQNRIVEVNLDAEPKLTVWVPNGPVTVRQWRSAGTAPRNGMHPAETTAKAAPEQATNAQTPDWQYVITGSDGATLRVRSGFATKDEAKADADAWLAGKTTRNATVSIARLQ